MEDKKQKGEQKKEQKKSSFFFGLFDWKIEERELKNQIENYTTLGFFKSSRKSASALMILSALLTLILVMVGWIFPGAWIDVIAVLILAFFVYKGQKWAIILTMIYWTFSKVFLLFGNLSLDADNNFSSFIMQLVWWAIFMRVFWQAYQVERARKKLS